MVRLDDENAKRLQERCRQLAEPEAKEPFAIVRTKQIVICNHHFVMSWPLPLVDLTGQFIRWMISNGNRKTSKLIDKLTNNSWVELIVPDDAKYVKTEEVDPTGVELECMGEDRRDACLIYTFGNKRYAFRAVYCQLIVESCTGDISTQLYLEEGYNPTLVFFEDDKRIGAISRYILGGYSDAPPNT